MQTELAERLDDFSKVTMKLQTLLGLADLSSTSLYAEKETGVDTQELGITTDHKGTDAPGYEFEELSSEGILPKVVVCGMQNQIPGIIICEGPKKKQPNYEYEELNKFLSPEDKLPKIAICGKQGQIPGIVLCGGCKKKRASQSLKNICRKDYSVSTDYSCINFYI